MQPRASFTASWVRYYAGWIDKLDGQVVPSHGGNGLDYVRARALRRGRRDRSVERPDDGHGPEGVTGAGRRQHRGGEAAGDRAVRRAAVRRAGARSGAPAGVLNVVPAVRSPATRWSAIPASTRCRSPAARATARQVMAAAAETLKPLALELGGKSANIDLPRRRPRPRRVHARRCSARCCSAARVARCPTRLYVHDDVYDEVVERVVAQVEATSVGDPLDPQVLMGPVVNEAACNAHPRRDRAGHRRGARARCSPAGSGSAATSPTATSSPPPCSATSTTPATSLARRSSGRCCRVLRFRDEDEVVAQGQRQPLRARRLPAHRRRRPWAPSRRPASTSDRSPSTRSRPARRRRRSVATSRAASAAREAAPASTSSSARRTSYIGY